MEFEILITFVQYLPSSFPAFEKFLNSVEGLLAIGSQRHKPFYFAKHLVKIFWLKSHIHQMRLFFKL